MGKSRKRSRSRSRNRCESPVLSKRHLQKQIDVITKTVLQLVEAQKAAMRTAQTVSEPQQAQNDENSAKVPESNPTEAPSEDANKEKDQIQHQKDVEEGEVLEEDLGDLDEELLEVLGEEIPASSSQVKVNEKLKKWWKDWMDKGLSEEVRKELLKKYPRDGELVTEAPKINLEVQRHLTEIAKKRDEHFTQTQKCVGSAITSLAGAVSLLTEPSSELLDQTLLLKHLWDAGKILTDVFHQQSSARKSFITPTLDKDLKPTLDASVSDVWLYGEKLSEQVKDAKAIVKAAAVLKTSEKPANKRPSGRSFSQGNGRSLPVRPRQAGSYFPRRVRNVNYRQKTQATTSRYSQGSSSEKTQSSRKK